jgi:trans-aconitate methyltransferase
MADEFPGAEVIGVDISPTQPHMVPPNVRFQVDDVEETWSYSSPFDLIHCRYMPACISDFPKLIRQAYADTKPGGWVEFADGDLRVYSEDGTLTDQHAFKKLHTLFLEACKVMGKVGSPAQYLKQWIEEAGFVNITHKIIKLPLGVWPKEKKEVGSPPSVSLCTGS